MQISAVSGYGIKGPAAFVVETDGRRLLLDLGEGPEHGRRPSAEAIGRVDAIILSHSHADHVGALDLAPQLGSPPIWCTPIVARLVDVARFGQVESLPLSGAAEILGVPVLTGRAGHAPGGVWLRLGGPEGVLYTGDLSFESVLYAQDRLPRAAGLIVDASYGAYDGTLDTGIAAIAEVAARGPLLLPAPAGGRGLEMAVALSERGFAVRLCPAHRHVMDVILADPTALPASATSRLQQLAGKAGSLDEDSEPDGVMLAAAADAETGVAAKLVERWSANARVGTVFTGHFTATSPSNALIAAGRAQFIRWNVHPPLPHLRAIIADVAPRRVLPAFLAAEKLPALAAALDIGDRLAGPEFTLP